MYLLSCSIFFDAIVPMLCAFITGIITLSGVILTIKHTQKQMNEERRLSNKPYLNVINSMLVLKDLHPSKVFNVGDDKSSNNKIVAYVKNTDNGLAQIVSISLDKEHVYTQFYSKLIEKNELVLFYIYLGKSQPENVRPVLRCKDVFGNEYSYLLEVDGKRITGGIIELDDELRDKLDINY